MKVCSWNMYCYNKHLDEALLFIRNADAEVLCLQEVPAKFLPILEALPVRIASAVDSERTRSGREYINYNVILSKLPIVSSHSILLPPLLHPKRTKLVITLMKPAGWARTRNRNILAAHIQTKNGIVQVFCTHLTLSSPGARAREFATLLKYRDPHLPAIIAGDFNVLEHPRVKPMSWFLGAPIEESLPTFPERTLFEERFRNAQFKNPLRGRVTHAFSKSQLDHVLVSDALRVISSHVDPDKYGSDHHPVFVVCNAVRS